MTPCIDTHPIPLPSLACSKGLICFVCPDGSTKRLICEEQRGTEETQQSWICVNHLLSSASAAAGLHTTSLSIPTGLSLFPSYIQVKSAVFLSNSRDPGSQVCPIFKTYGACIHLIYSDKHRASKKPQRKSARRF